MIYLLMLILTACSSGEISAVSHALSIYFTEYNRYPENLEALVGQSGVNEETIRHFGYSPKYNFGTYQLEYFGEKRHILFAEPPYSKQTLNAKEVQLATGLWNFYRDFGRFPKDLREFGTEFGERAMKEINTGIYQYEIYHNSQAFSLNGKTYGPPPPRGLEKEPREYKVLSLRTILHSFYLRYGRYPHDFEELTDSGAGDSHYIPELIEGENIKYSVSQDGQNAFLEDEELGPVPP